MPWVSESDADAIHDNVAGEIAAITEKTTPVDADLVIIEDSEASNAKKKVQLLNVGGWEVIADETLSAGAVSYAFSSIPGTFAHLRLYVEARSGDASSSTTVGLRFNSDATTSYITQELLADGTTVSTSQPSASNTMDLGRIAAANATSGYSGSIVVDIPDYATNRWQQRVTTYNNYREGTAGPALRQHAGEWVNTGVSQAVTNIGLFVAGTFVTGSRFTLYGLRGL